MATTGSARRWRRRCVRSSRRSLSSTPPDSVTRSSWCAARRFVSSYNGCAMLNLLSAFGEVLLPVVVVVTLGYFLRRSFPLDARSLNRVSLYVLTPCLVFVALLRTDVAGGEATR